MPGMQPVRDASSFCLLRHGAIDRKLHEMVVQNEEPLLVGENQWTKRIEEGDSANSVSSSGRMEHGRISLLVSLTVFAHRCCDGHLLLLRDRLFQDLLGSNEGEVRITSSRDP